MNGLTDYADELLVIGLKLDKLIEPNNFPKPALTGFVDLLEDILLLPIDEDRVRTMAKAGVLANLAHLKLIQMKHSSELEKAKVLDLATVEMMKMLQMGFKGGGHFGMRWLLLPFEAIKLVIQQFDSFNKDIQPRVRLWLNGMLQPAFDQPEELFLKGGEALPPEVSDLVLSLYQMPRTKQFPEVYSRCAEFFNLLNKLETGSSTRNLKSPK